LPSEISGPGGLYLKNGAVLIHLLEAKPVGQPGDIDRCGGRRFFSIYITLPVALQIDGSGKAKTE